MAERVDVMISSTARDLPDYRQQALDACVRQGMFPIMMEHLPAMDEDAISASMAMVDEAEIYLGIFANRYGYVPAGHDISITEMEYNRATERGIPRLIFIMDDTIATDKERDPSKLAKLEAFKQRLKTEQVVNFFSSPADFRAEVINSLSHLNLRQTITLHRPNFIPAPPAPYIAHPYTLLESGGLFGRKSELKLLNNWLDPHKPDMANVRILNIVAIGGMGKSSLTWKWFHELDNMAGRLWWSFYESDAHYENFITRALCYVSHQTENGLRKLSLPQREEQLLNILNQEPHLLVLDGLERILVAYHHSDAARQLEEQFEKTKKAAASINRIASIVGLPGIADPSQTHQYRLRKTADPRAGVFLRKLASLDNSRVLVSTRLYPADLETQAGTEIAGSAALMLSGLDDKDALKLWRSFEVTGTEDALLELFHAFDNYPLLIRALAGEVARYRRAPGDFDQWRQFNPDFNPFALPMVQRQSHVLQFALNGLEETHVGVLRTIAAFKAPASYGTLLDVLVGAEKQFATENELDAALTELEDRGLLGWDRNANRYDLHPVVRGVVWSSLHRDVRKGIYEQLRTHFDAMPAITDWRKIKKREDLTASIELYSTLIGLERYDEGCDLLMNRLYRPLRYRFSDGQQLASLLEMLFPDNHPLPKLEETAHQAWVLNALAQAYQMLGEPGRAVPLFERSNQLKEQYSYTVDLSQGLRDLAYAQRLVGGLRYSEASARRALLSDRADENRLLEAISLQVLGLALAARGQYDESAKALDRSLDLADRTNANRAYNHHAMRALWFGDHSAALDWSEKGILYCEQRRLGAGLILAHRLQGEAYIGLLTLELAEERLHYALAHARAASLMEEEIAALIAMAELRRLQSKLDIARELLGEVWHACEHAPYRLFHADAMNVLAAIERDADNREKAIDAATRAYQLSWCDGPPYAYHRGLMTAQTHLGILDAAEPQLPPFDPDVTMPMVFVEIDPPHTVR